MKPVQEVKPEDWEIRIKIEEILKNRILFIGNEIPEYFITDNRSKQLYLGYPQQLIDELTKVVAQARNAALEEGIRLCADHLVTLKDGEHSFRDEAEKLIKIVKVAANIEKLKNKT